MVAAFCTLIMATGTILAAAPVLWTLAAIAAVGSVFPFHPVDLLYNHFVRRLTRGRGRFRTTRLSGGSRAGSGRRGSPGPAWLFTRAR